MASILLEILIPILTETTSVCNVLINVLSISKVSVIPKKANGNAFECSVK